MKRVAVWFGVWLMVLTSAAVAQKLEVKTEQDPKADFQSIKTYAWLTPTPIIRNAAPGAPSNPTLSEEAIAPYIVAAIDRQLAARGLVKAPLDQADIQVVYVAAISSAVSSSYLGEHYGYITGWGSPIIAGAAPTTALTGYDKGTIVVDVVTPSAKRAIWRASVATKIELVRAHEDRVKRIDTAMQRVFEKFPIKARK